MTFGELLLGKKTAIVQQWFDLVMESYPADTAAFMKEQKNRFANPIGSTIFQAMEKLIDELIAGIQIERATPYLDSIIRIRAVQDFTPSQAVAFVFSLKKVMSEACSREVQEYGLSKELLSAEASVDSLALVAFDIFMKCREKIYEIRVNELRRMTFRLLQKANMLDETKTQDPVFISFNRVNVNQKEGVQ